VYATQAPAEADVGVFNAFPEDTELLQAGKALNVWTGNMKLRLVRPGGTVILATACSEGLGFHSLVDRGMRMYARAGHRQEEKDIFAGRQVIVFAPTSSRPDFLEKYDDTAVHCRTWAEVLAHLMRKRGRQSVTVFPNGSLQHIE
jgi:hypothetical protein